MNALLFTVLVVAIASVSGCGTSASTTGASDYDATNVVANSMTDQQAQNALKSVNAYGSVHITENAEIENIQRYITLTTRPGMIGYVTLFTLGRPIAYYTVKGPVTDCNRELTPMLHVTNGRGWATGADNGTVDSPNDEGTYGGNAHCIFFFNEDGVMIRWSGEYLYSSQPIRLSEKPLVITVVKGN